VSADPARRDEIAELSKSVETLSKQVVSLSERVARLEEDNKWLRQELAEIKSAVNGIRRNDMAILASVLTVFVTVLVDLLVRLAIAH